MKFMLIVMGFCLSSYAVAQVSWSDSFADSSLQVNPRWTGDTNRFVHNSSQRLQLYDSDANVTHLRTQSAVSHSGIWEGWLFMDFNPSSSNYCSVTLCSDGAGQQYRLQFGGNTDDRLQLFYEVGGQQSLLFESAPNLLSSPKLEWRVERFADSIWTFEVNIDSTQWVAIGTCPDTTVFASSLYEWTFHYTKTRSDRFQIDNLSTSGTPFLDTTRPFVVGHNILDKRTIQLFFQESVTVHADSNVEDSNGGVWTPLQLTSTSVELVRDSPLNSGLHVLDLKAITDPYRNPAMTFTFPFHLAAFRDLMCTEIMYDVQPLVHWDTPYLEFENTSSYDLNLTDWTLLIDEKSYPLQGEIAPKQRLIISPGLSNVPPSLLQIPIASTAIKSSGRLRIISNWGDTIESIYYNAQMHTVDWKSNGGWSLERNDAPTCQAALAWSTSQDPLGGTPGSVNSAISATKEMWQTVKGIEWNTEAVILQLHEAATSVTEADSTLRLRNVNLDGLSWTIPRGTEGLDIHIQLCSGQESDTSLMAIAKPEAPGTLRITEILTDPLFGEPEYVELKNTGTSAVLSSDLRISQWSINGGIERLYELSETPWLIMPNETVLVVSDLQLLPFPTDQRQNLRSVLWAELPFALPNDGGLCLTAPNGEILDAINWSDEQHTHQDSDNGGKSLERAGGAYDQTLWKTTSVKWGYRTPGFEPHNIPVGNASEIDVKSARCSPNGDGYEDSFEFVIPEKYEGWNLKLLVLNSQGILLGTPINEEVYDPVVMVRWDGKLNGKPLPTQQYLLHLELWNDQGEKKSWIHGCLIVN